MPGFGPFLGASLLVGAGDLPAYPSAGHLAAAAGLVPVPNDSGRRTGNLHRPKRYSRRLRHVFYLSAQTSMMRAGPNRDFYLKKRGEAPPTARPSSPWPAAGSTSCGPCCARTEPGPQHRQPRSGRLTTPLRFPVPGLGSVLGRERPLVDGEHRLLEPRGRRRSGAAGRGDGPGRCAAANDAAAPTVTAASTVIPAGRRPGRCSRDTTTSPGRPGNVRRRCRLICCGLHRCDNSSPITRGELELVSTRRRCDAPAERSRGGAPRTGDTLPAATALRRSSREIVDGARPSRRAISARSHPQVQIGDLDPLVLGQEPRADLAHAQPVQAEARTRRPRRADTSL